MLNESENLNPEFSLAERPDHLLISRTHSTQSFLCYLLYNWRGHLVNAPAANFVFMVSLYRTNLNSALMYTVLLTTILLSIDYFNFLDLRERIKEVVR